MASMLAIRIHRFGPPEVMSSERIARPRPGPGEVLVRVSAAGVGPWDAWVRAGKSALPQPLPLTLGSDFSGRVEAVGDEATGFAIGSDVFGVTNPQFTGAYAEYAIASARMIAAKPKTLSHAEAASVPVVAVTAEQMLFDHGGLQAGQTVLVHGAAGNVGAYAVQLAKRAGARVVATTMPDDVDYVKALGAAEVVEVTSQRFEEVVGPVDVVIDTVGGGTQSRSFSVLARGGVLVSSVSPPPQEEAVRRGARAVFFIVDVTRSPLARLAALIDAGELQTHLGAVLPLGEARTAHEMLEGRRTRPRGKIVLAVEPS